MSAQDGRYIRRAYSVTRDEAALLDEAAHLARMSVSEYVRECALTYAAAEVSGGKRLRRGGLR